MLMSGLENLRAKLSELGLNSNSINSKAVEMTVSVLANNDDIDVSLAFKGLLDEYNEKRNYLNSKLRELEKKEYTLISREKTLSNNQKMLEERGFQLQRMVSEFEDCLSECETSEGRDAIRRAAFFITNTKINTCYDNTAYINGLANLLIGVTSDMPNDIKETVDNAKNALSDMNKNIIFNQKEI